MFICDTPVTAGGRTYLKTLTLAKLKKYVNVYNIKIDRAVEKDDLIDGILSIRVRYMGATSYRVIPTDREHSETVACHQRTRSYPTTCSSFKS